MPDFLLWSCVASLMDGDATSMDCWSPDHSASLEITDDIISIIGYLEDSCTYVTLTASPGYEDWLSTVAAVDCDGGTTSSDSSACEDVPVPTVLEFEIEICVPASTPPGRYVFTIDATCDGLLIAQQLVTLDVECPCIPRLECPPDMSVAADDLCGAHVVLPDAVDNSGCPDVVITSDAASRFPEGTTAVTYTVSGPDGIDSCRTLLTVTDLTAPDIICPSPIIAELTTHEGTPVNIPVSVTDNCDPEPCLTSDAPALFPLGTTTVTFTAVDNSGNETSCTVEVIVQDTTPPVIACPPPLTLEQESHAGTVVDLVACAWDIGDEDVTVTSDDLPVYPLGSTVVTFTAVDDSGNTTSCTTTITVVDRIPPVMSCPPDVTVEQESHVGTVFPLSANATDICDSDVAITDDTLPVYPLGTTQVTFTGEDNAGNTSTCITLVNVVDTIQPDISGIAGVEEGACYFTDPEITFTCTDICDSDPTSLTSIMAVPGTECEKIATLTCFDRSGNVRTETIHFYENPNDCDVDGVPDCPECDPDYDTGCFNVGRIVLGSLADADEFLDEDIEDMLAMNDAGDEMMEICDPADEWMDDENEDLLVIDGSMTLAHCPMGTVDRCLDSLNPDDQVIVSLGDIVLVDTTIGNVEHPSPDIWMYHFITQAGNHRCLVLSCSSCMDCIEFHFRGRNTGFTGENPEETVKVTLGYHAGEEMVALQKFGDTVIYVDLRNNNCCN